MRRPKQGETFSHDLQSISGSSIYILARQDNLQHFWPALLRSGPQPLPLEEHGSADRSSFKVNTLALSNNHSLLYQVIMCGPRSSTRPEATRPSCTCISEGLHTTLRRTVQSSTLSVFAIRVDQQHRATPTADVTPCTGLRVDGKRS